MLLNCGIWKDLRVPWTERRANQSILKEISPESSIGRTNAEAETPILWPPDVKNWLIWKDPGAGIDWRREEKGTTEDKMVGWHHRLNGHEFEQAPGVGDGQGGLACCIHGVSKSHTWLSNWTELNWTYPSFAQDVRESFLCEISRKAFAFLMKSFHHSWHCLSLFIFPFCSWNADVITGVQQPSCCYRMSSIKNILIQY